MHEKKRKRTGREITVSRPRVNHAPPKARPIAYTILSGNSLSPRVVAVLIALSMIIAGGGTYMALENKQANPAIPATPFEATAVQTSTPVPTPTVTSVPLIDKVSEKGKKFIVALEGISLVPYTDAAGYCTIGIGHVPEWKWCYGHSQITEAQAYDFFDQDISNTEAFLKNELKEIHLNQCQFDAMSSFEFNAGPYTFRYSGVAIDLRLGRFTDIPYDLENYIYSAQNGNPQSGLLVRRKAEGALFSDCNYGFQ